MELIYIYIKDYKGIIKNQEYNFGGEYLFSYDGRFLFKKKNFDYFEHFFGKEINNITAIVGKNGSGKSTLLNFIAENLSKDKNDSLSLVSECIIIIKQDKDYKVIVHENIKIENESQYNIIRFKDKKEITSSEATIVRYSNIFDLNTSDTVLAGNGYVDMTTNFLLRNYGIPGDEDESFNILEMYKIGEIYSQVKFVYSNKDENLFDFKLPSEIEISVNEFDSLINKWDYLDEAIEEFLNDDLENEMNVKRESEDAAEAIREAFDDYVEENEFCKNFLKILIEDLIYTCDLFIKQEIKLRYKYDRNDYVKVKKIVIETLYMSYKLRKNIIHEISNIFNTIVKKLSECEIKDKDIVTSTQMRAELYSYVKSKQDILKDDKLIFNQNEDITRLLDIYTCIQSFTPFLNFKWREMSSGQIALLTLYSRFFLNKSNLKDSNLILIDEGELYFHPEWQKKMINNLVNNLPLIINESSENKSLQIIMSSNSPFLISDLPNNNVMFLNQNNDSFAHNNTHKFSTFGANIHELLSNTFFLTTTIGDFASDKIKNVIKDLSKDKWQDIDEKRKMEIKYIINNIGEPVIKNKLEQLYIRVWPKKEEDYRFKIEELEKERERLQRIIDNAEELDLDNVLEILNLKIEELRRR